MPPPRLDTRRALAAVPKVSSSSVSMEAVRCCGASHTPQRRLLSTSSSCLAQMATPTSSALAIRNTFGRRPRTAGALYLLACSSPALFSTTATRPAEGLRKRMRMWLKTSDFRPVKASVALSPDRHNSLEPPRFPFPRNPLYRSESVLSDHARELVWSKVIKKGESIKAVAAELSIDMRRVVAVVRLKQIEKQWLIEGKAPAKPYANAVQSMLPTHSYRPGEPIRPFEPINELHVHSYTKQQLFVPVSESRHFTREDAAHAFHPTVLSADKRVPLPELIDLERDVFTSKDSERTAEDAFADFSARMKAQEEAWVARERKAAAAEEARTTRVGTSRYEFRFRDYNAEDVGKQGRSLDAPGWRYGRPFRDRKKGQVKIPTSVG